MTDQPERQQQERLEVVIKELVEGWQEYVSTSEDLTLGQRQRRPDPIRFASVFALAAHTHLVVDLAMDLLNRGEELLALPLLRLGYESALTAAWMAQNEEGALALHNNEISARTALLKTAGDSNQFAHRVAGLTEEAKIDNVTSDAQAKKFWLLCEDFAGDGKTLYLLYRLLCKFSHPTGFVIDRFVTVDEDSVTALSMHPRTCDDDQALWYLVAAMSLIYSGRAVDFIEPARSRRSELRAAAREVGVPAELELSVEAKLRVGKATRVRLRSRRQAAADSPHQRTE